LEKKKLKETLKRRKEKGFEKWGVESKKHRKKKKTKKIKNKNQNKKKKKKKKKNQTRSGGKGNHEEILSWEPRSHAGGI